jgi:hypothetical protein
LIGRAYVNLAINMPPESGLYIVQYIRLADLDSPVRVIAESAPFNFVYQSNADIMGAS